MYRKTASSSRKSSSRAVTERQRERGLLRPGRHGSPQHRPGDSGRSRGSRAGSRSYTPPYDSSCSRRTSHCGTGVVCRQKGHRSRLRSAARLTMPAAHWRHRAWLQWSEAARRSPCEANGSLQMGHSWRLPALPPRPGSAPSSRSRGSLASTRSETQASSVASGRFSPRATTASRSAATTPASAILYGGNSTRGFVRPFQSSTCSLITAHLLSAGVSRMLM